MQTRLARAQFRTGFRSCQLATSLLANTTAILLPAVSCNPSMDTCQWSISAAIKPLVGAVHYQGKCLVAEVSVRFICSVLLIWIVATGVLLIAARTVRGLSMPSGVGFWATLVLLLVATYPVFLRLLARSRFASASVMYRALAAALLSCVTYLVVINAAFFIAT